MDSLTSLMTCEGKEEQKKNQFVKCDTIKGNESLVEKCNSLFLTPLSHNYTILYFDANSIEM